MSVKAEGSMRIDEGPARLEFTYTLELKATRGVTDADKARMLAAALEAAESHLRIAFGGVVSERKLGDAEQVSASLSAMKEHADKLADHVAAATSRAIAKIADEFER